MGSEGVISLVWLKEECQTIPNILVETAICLIHNKVRGKNPPSF